MFVWLNIDIRPKHTMRSADNPNKYLYAVEIGGHGLLTSHPSNTVELQGNTARFSCETDSAAAINWNFDSFPASPTGLRLVTGGILVESFSNKFTLTIEWQRSVLTLNSITKSDSGTYSCIDELGMGEKASAELIVLGKKTNNTSI